MSGPALYPAGFPPCPGCLHWLPGPVSPGRRADPASCPGCIHTHADPRPSQTWLRLPGNHTGAPWKRCMSPFSNGPSPTLSTWPTLTPSSLEHGTPDPALSTAIPHAGDWLNVVPSRALGLHLQDWEFRVSLQYWLGLQMADELTPCSMCRSAGDPHGDHQVGCGGNGDQIHPSGTQYSQQPSQLR